MHVKLTCIHYFFIKNQSIYFMPYYRVVLNIPIPPLTYFHEQTLALGTRVLVQFRKHHAVGIVWENDIQPDIDINKILSIQTIFNEEPPLPPTWIQMINFTSKYYHYPLGLTAFTALPQYLRKNKSFPTPQLPIYYHLNHLGHAQTPPPSHAHKKQALWNALATGKHQLQFLKKIHHQAQALLQNWQEQNFLEIQEEDVNCIHISPSNYTLNREQNYAVTTITATLKQFRPFLLYGITGSGKTEVYFEVIAQALTSGKQVLFLLPEINLTPQLLQRIQQRFTNIPIAVLHSQTAQKQRCHDYFRSLLSQAKLIIGTRLAVFTPMANLGLIIVDEEHDSSFKQDNELRYNARDLAIWRAQQAKCPIILGSATPSLTSWHKSKTGTYQLLTLNKRAHNQAQLPNIQLLDIRHSKLNNGISPQALALLQENYHNKGLSLVYLNRRGYAPVLFCSDCGYTFSCRNCSTKTVLHQKLQQLRCHHCGFHQDIPSYCPQCGNQDLKAIGQGTQRIEETLKTIFKDAHILRIDRDSISHKNDWDQIYHQIAAQQVDILIGTQMLSKGHNFAQLNLIIVLNADGSLYSADFRAPERLFAELTQISGRAGRDQHTSNVYIQTQLPNNPILNAVQMQNYAHFADNQLEERKMFSLPPFVFQAAIHADAPNIDDAIAFLNEIKDFIAPILPKNVIQMGATPMLLTRLAQRERAQLFLESPSRRDLHCAVSLWQNVLQQYHLDLIRWNIDIDPEEI